MIFGWIIGLVIALVCLIVTPDEATKGWMILAVVYFTIGLSVDCYKLQNKLPITNYDKKLAELAKACSQDNLDIRKQLLVHIKYMQDINEMYSSVIKEQELIKNSLLEFTKLLESVTSDTPDNINNNNVETKETKDPYEKL